MNANWPNFFIIGEPRSGTTSLHDWLVQHPDIFMSQVKEPHYFSELTIPSPDDSILQVTRDKADYLKLFAGSQQYARRGESSTYYMADPASPGLIKKAVPEAKLIAVLRDPIERAYSHYLLFGRRGQPELSFLETVQQNLSEPANEQTLARNLVEMGYFHKHLKNYLRYFKKDQLLVLLFEDIKNQPQKVLEEVFNFLGVDSTQAATIETGQAHNSYTTPRNQLVSRVLANQRLTKMGLKMLPRSLVRKVRNDILLKKSDKPPLDPAAKQLLAKAYKPEIARLEKLLDRDLGALSRSLNNE